MRTVRYTDTICKNWKFKHIVGRVTTGNISVKE